MTIPGRYEVINNLIILDVAHNPPAMLELADFIGKHEDKKPVMIYGAMKDKDIHRALLPFANTIESLYLLELDNDGRGATPAYIESKMPQQLISLYHKTEANNTAFTKAIAEAEEKGRKVLITGSFFAIAAFHAYTKRGV
jgi:dihydrofolate synthase/folylpolyglutamate synthase